MNEQLLRAVDKMMEGRGEGKATESKSSRLCYQRRRYASTIVFLIRSKKMKVTTVRSMIESLPEGFIGVFVGCGPPTPFSKKEIQASGSQYFVTKELIVPVVSHPLVPPHKKINEAPKGLDTDRLPVLSIDDPVSKYYRYKKGDIIEIDRGKYKYYRVVN